MPQYEYKVVPAPLKGERAKGLKGTRERFAHTLMALMNEMGRDGWEYLRADTLPCEERQGLTGRTTTFQNMLIFRRALGAEAPVPGPERAPRSPEEIAAAAAATLSAGAEPGNAPAVARGSAGAAPSLGPARRDAARDGDKGGDGDNGRNDGVAAE
ncbi:DUF4177 domain-containing protein [Actibacterium sp. MT2.3-13A]|uniref:DUF4177 domain-containing protein n=1 Tax=Actibacterium sp. MT2.3-13A TaxID=2828332 RepID=UPI001BAD0201|nr:DUF4177 domain-containing protein [Actibacterium sp. MT2.3-13A]